MNQWSVRAAHEKLHTQYVHMYTCTHTHHACTEGNFKVKPQPKYGGIPGMEAIVCITYLAVQ